MGKARKAPSAKQQANWDRFAREARARARANRAANGSASPSEPKKRRRRKAKPKGLLQKGIALVKKHPVAAVLGSAGAGALAVPQGRDVAARSARGVGSRAVALVRRT